ncbi:hypothetical protein B0H16DRAFT_1795271 [Mycena metata]|uniref:Uncharacterized protein n=1 Tax=Mycena metata TaxID=1033252 RepID=A0AAD7HG31_9AGAR|nr:hypothetical protein B0H16DRAFT_1795271 [Mycena metata]
MTEIRLKNISTCVTITANTLDVLVNTLNISSLKAISKTTHSLLKMMETIKQDKNNCAELMEHIHQLLNAIVGVYIKSDTGAELPPSVLNQIAKFTETLHKIHVFVEAQQSGSKVNKFFQQGELHALLKDCKAGLQQGLVFFQMRRTTDILVDVQEMQDQAQLRYQELLDLVEIMSSSDSTSSVSNMYSGSYTSYSGKDLTQEVLEHLTSAPPSLLILDNLETPWEPVGSRKEIEEFLSLLTDVASLALLVTMRGAERPAKVQWTQPFLLPLGPLSQEAARKMFIEITDDRHSMEEVDQVLHLTDNMPLSISLLAHLVDMEDCSTILSRWKTEKTSLISEGSDRGSNLELSISLSLSSPRITSMPHSQDLLGLLFILPDGLSDVELKQSKFPIQDILGCKAALLRTALAYTDDHKRLKVLVPVREYMGRCSPPTDLMIRPLLAHFHELLELYVAVLGKESGAFPIARITSNYTNIQNVLQCGLQLDHPDMAKSIYCTCDFNHFSRFYPIPHPKILVTQALNHLKHLAEPALEVRFHNTLAWYYLQQPHGVPEAIEHCQIALHLAQTNGNYKEQCIALVSLSWIEWLGGNYTVARAYAQEAQRLAKLSGDLFQEAIGLYYEHKCQQVLGDYESCILLCTQARTLLGLCGMLHGELNHHLGNSRAGVYLLKSEYTEGHLILSQILQDVLGDQNPYVYGLTLASIAELEVLMGSPTDEIQSKIGTSKAIFERQGHKRVAIFALCYQAALNLREGDMSSLLFRQCLRSGWGNFADIVSYCFERLGDISCWEGSQHPSSWTTVFLAHAIKENQRLEIHKALQFLGDVFLKENDEATAVSLFTVALEGFTQMDVHRSRAQCMIRLGDIAQRNDDFLRALALWETARPLFERSSQVKRVYDIDERLSGIGEEVKEQHRMNLIHLAELNAPAGKVGDVAGDLSDDELEEKHISLAVV